MLTLRPSDQAKVVVRVSSVAVPCERLCQMRSCLLVFGATVIGKTQSSVGRCEAGVPFQCLFVSHAGFALFAFLVEGQALDVGLLRTAVNLWITNRTHRRLERVVAINRGISAVPD